MPTDDGKITESDVKRFKSAYFHVRAARNALGKTISDNKKQAGMKMFKALDEMAETLAIWNEHRRIS